jgi:hypothetical protein
MGFFISAEYILVEWKSAPVLAIIVKKAGTPEMSIFGKISTLLKKSILMRLADMST